MDTKKKVNRRYTHSTDTEKQDVLFEKPTTKTNGNDLIYSILDAMLTDWDRIK